MIVLLAALGLLAAGPAPAGPPAPRQGAVLVREYAGPYQTEFAAQFDRVRLLVRQAQLEVSSRLGLLQYQEGFRYPLTIRFDDGAPAGLENALAYVRFGRRGQGFEQELVVNLDELAARPSDFDSVFYHEMTHAVMNDAVGEEASYRIPRWLQEGLAVFVSGDGDLRVQMAGDRLPKSLARTLVFKLDGPVYGNAYPQYYLAVKYLLDKHSINAVQGVVRELIEGKPLTEAIQNATGLSWEQYKQNVSAYSLRIFQDLARPDHVAYR